MSSSFGSNLKEADVIKSSNRSRRVVSGSSGYGQQEVPSRSPKQAARVPKFSQEAAQQGKIKAFINLDDIPDGGYSSKKSYGKQYDDDDDDDDDEHDQREEGKIRLGAAAQKLLSNNDDDDDFSSNHRAGYSSPHYAPQQRMNYQQQRVIPKLSELRPMQQADDIEMNYSMQMKAAPRDRSQSTRPTSSKSDKSDDNKMRRMIAREVKKISSPTAAAAKPSLVKGSKYRDDDDDDWGDECDGYEQQLDKNAYSKYDYIDSRDAYDDDGEPAGYARRDFTRPQQQSKKPVVADTSKKSSAPVVKVRRSVSVPKPSINEPPPLPYEASPPKPLRGHDKLAYSKEPRTIAYKPNTKPLPKGDYVEIQNLKPDLNSAELIAKRANVERIKEFAKNLHEYNRNTLLQQKKLPASTEVREIVLDKMKHESKRNKALEFAKQIPKPKIGREQDGKMKNSMQRVDEEDDYMTANDEFGFGYKEFSKIQSLEVKHEESRKQVEAIRRAMCMGK